MNRSLLLAAALAVISVLSGCQKEITCPSGEAACNGACIDPGVDTANCGACGHACGAGTDCRAGACVALSTDRLNCGAVDHACLPGESCLSGTCTSLQVACFSVDEVRAVEPLDLASGAAPRAAGVGPIALTTLGADVWAAASLSGSLVKLPIGGGAPSEYPLHGNDFEYVAARSGRVVISNAGGGTVVIADPSTGGLAGEIPVGTSAGDNIKGIAFATRLGGGQRAVVSLQGDAVTGDPALGQKVAVLDAAGLGTCGTAGAPLPCLGAANYLDVSAGADAPGLAFPGRSIAYGGKVYVVLGNLKKGASGYFTDPAGPGKLAVVDPAGPSVSYASLGAGCGNPGGLALRGSTLWVACAAFGASGLAEVDLSTAPPTVVAVHPVPVTAPGNVAFCGDHGFVTDQWSGDVYPFDPVNYASSPAAATSVCPKSAGQYGWAWASDVACAARP